MAGTYFLLYEGPSQIDGEPIVVVAYLGSSNAKTLGMLETYILSQEMEPHAATKAGRDKSVCGGCPMRPMLARAARARAKKAGKRVVVPNCYVNTFYGPRAAYKAWKEDRALPSSLEVLSAMLPVRVGSYGDPAAAPFEVWAPLLENPTARWTGYTHQWASKTTDPRLKRICMASIDTPDQFPKAKAQGWRTFNVQKWLANDTPAPPVKDALTCPASAEAGHARTCIMCQLCTGTSSNGPDITIIDHGHSTRQAWKRYNAKLAEQDVA